MTKRLEWNRKTAALLLAVVVPVTLVGVLLTEGEITIAETVTLEPVTWTFQRPPAGQYVVIEDKLESTYSSDGLSATFCMRLSDYIPRTGLLNYDTLRVRLDVNATTSNPDGFIESVHMVAYKDKESLVELQEDDFCFENLSLAASLDGYRLSTQAYIKLAGVNHTSIIYAKATALWKLLTPNTQPHQLQLAYEKVYYNGTVYNKVFQPFHLNLLGREQA